MGSVNGVAQVLAGAVNEGAAGKMIKETDSSVHTEELQVPEGVVPQELLSLYLPYIVQQPIVFMPELIWPLALLRF